MATGRLSAGDSFDNEYGNTVIVQADLLTDVMGFEHVCVRRSAANAVKLRELYTLVEAAALHRVLGEILHDATPAPTPPTGDRRRPTDTGHA